MKILTFSDWRVQPLEFITEIINELTPDVILYGGDDLNRFIEINNEVTFKIGSHLFGLKYPEFEPVNENDLITPNFKKYANKIAITENDFLRNLKIPFFYCNGNDDQTFQDRKKTFIRVHSGIVKDDHQEGRYIDDYKISMTKTGKLTFRQTEYTVSNYFEEDRMRTERSYGVYKKSHQSVGRFIMNANKEDISIFSFNCTFGLESDVTNAPKQYADIFLTHVPPYGVLDLSKRFGINHIGSKKLLNLIKKYEPKLVICGHSHIWGGQVAKINNTVVLNVSSQDRDPSFGNYAIIDTHNWSVKEMQYEDLSLRRIRGRNTVISYFKELRQEKMEKEDNGGILTNNRNAKYPDGIKRSWEDIGDATRLLNIDNLSKAYKTKKLSNIWKEVESFGINTTNFRRRYECIGKKKPTIISRLTFNPDNFAFLDVETGLANGPEPGELWLVGLLFKDVLRQFQIPEEKNDLIRYLRKEGINKMVSWTRYDIYALRPFTKKAKINIKYIDAAARSANCVIWHSYRLHEFHDALFNIKMSVNESIPGHIAGLYADHIINPKFKCKYCPPTTEIIEQIKARNRKDLRQMHAICIKLRDLKV